MLGVCRHSGRIYTRPVHVLLCGHSSHRSSTQDCVWIPAHESCSCRLPCRIGRSSADCRIHHAASAGAHRICIILLSCSFMRVGMYKSISCFVQLSAKNRPPREEHLAWRSANPLFACLLMGHKPQTLQCSVLFPSRLNPVAWRLYTA